MPMFARTKARKVLRVAGPPILHVVGTTALVGQSEAGRLTAAFGPWEPRASAVLTVAGIAVAGTGLVWSAFDRSRSEHDRTENRRLRSTEDVVRARLDRARKSLRRQAEQALVILSYRLRLDAEACVSLYLFHAGQLVEVARWSTNTRLRLPGRGRYPLTSGCIGRAWTDGQHEVNALPDPVTDIQRYLAVQAGYGIDGPTARNMRMKSRSYTAIRIDEPDGTHPLGVVLIESRSPLPLPTEKLNRYLRGGPARYIAYLLPALTPEPDDGDGDPQDL